MESSGSAAPGSPTTVSGRANSNDIDMEVSSSNETGRLQPVAQGTTLFVRMDQKTMLVKVMEALGANTAPVFSLIQCGENGFRLSIKLDLSGFRSFDGQCIGCSEVVGETSVNRSVAETSAILRAFQDLQDTHLIKIWDFSSRVVQKLDSYNIYNLLVEGMHSIKMILEKWEMTYGQSLNFGVDLERKQIGDNVVGPMSNEAKVYAVLGDSLACTTMNFHLKTANAKSEIQKLDNVIRRYEKSTALTGKFQPQNVYLKEVDLPSKDVLDYVLSFFGQEKAKCSNSQGADGLVHSSLQFKFPYWYIYQYGPNLTITGTGVTEAESHEDAAYEALLLLEKNFPVKIIDFNHSTRNQTIKTQKFLLSMLSRIIEVGEQLRKMWCELNSEIEHQNAMFRLDPKSLFSGNMVEDQIGAYKLCASGLDKVAKNSSNRYASCASHFKKLLKLNWQFLSLKSIMDKYSL